MTGIARTVAVVLACSAVAQVLLPTSAVAQTPLLEVENGETKLMQVYEDGGLVVRGTGLGLIPASGGGNRLMWYPAKAAFRAGSVAGQWDEANVGATSVAMGAGTLASGTSSTAVGLATVASGRTATAMGWDTKATGPSSTAMGQQTTASGHGSTAMGINTTASTEASTAMGINTLADGTHGTALGAGTRASGNESTAMGTETIAAGNRSTAIGFRTVAFGERSTAMGSYVATPADMAGSFVYGDAATEIAMNSVRRDEFAVRASGGFRLRTSSNLLTGCDLPAGSGTWDCTSSRLAKEGFEDLDGETVLGKLASMPIQRWRYRGTQTSHVGPTAEDFHAAFQLGQGPTTISTVDADGINLLAVQALERRTAEMRKENADLRRRLEALEAERSGSRK